MINSKKIKKEDLPVEEEKNIFEGIFKAMTDVEKEKYAKLSLSGIYDKRSNTIIMGEDAFLAITEFQNKMIEKYGEANDTDN